VSKAEAKHFPRPHDGIVEVDTPSSVPRTWQILPLQAVPTSAWQGGSQTMVEFLLPAYVGKVTSMNFEFDLQITDASGAKLVPSFNFLQRIETYIGGAVVESVEADELLQESFLYLTDQEKQTIAPSVNIAPNSAGFNDVTYAAGSFPTFWLPVWSNILNTAQPFVQGIQQELRLRLWFNTSIYQSGTGSGVSLQNMYLWVTEQVMSDTATRALHDAHQSGITYHSIIRDKFISSQASLPLESQFQVQMTSFTNQTAGLAVYVRPATTSNQNIFTKYPMDQLQLKDANNSDLTILTKGQQIVTFQNPWSVGCSPNNNPQPAVYVFPFSTNLLAVLREGKVLGGYQLTSMERINVYAAANAPYTTWNSGTQSSAIAYTPATGNSLTNVQIVAIAYEYVRLEVARRSLKVEYGA
jgi:hypothetical protein